MPTVTPSALQPNGARLARARAPSGALLRDGSSRSRTLRSSPAGARSLRCSSRSSASSVGSSSEFIGGVLVGCGSILQFALALVTLTLHEAGKRCARPARTRHDGSFGQLELLRDLARRELL